MELNGIIAHQLKIDLKAGHDRFTQHDIYNMGSWDHTPFEQANEQTPCSGAAIANTGFNLN